MCNIDEESFELAWPESVLRQIDQISVGTIRVDQITAERMPLSLLVDTDRGTAGRNDRSIADWRCWYCGALMSSDARQCVACGGWRR